MATDNQASAGEQLDAIEATHQIAVSRAALESFIEYADGLRSAVDGEFLAGRDEYEQSDREFSQHVNALTASELPADDALLASVMRKVLADQHGWVDFAAKDRRWQGPAWMTIDVRRVELTDEEYAAIERADQS